MDDDAVVRQIVVAALERAGYDVRTAPDCSTAAAELARNPQLMVVDIGLPDGNGLDVVRSVRAQETAQPTVVVLSGFRQETNVLSAFDAGADDFMTKPFSPQELVVRVGRERTARTA